jgi:hypothetical protein
MINVVIQYFTFPEQLISNQVNKECYECMEFNNKF